MSGVGYLADNYITDNPVHFWKKISSKEREEALEQVNVLNLNLH